MDTHSTKPVDARKTAASAKEQTAERRAEKERQRRSYETILSNTLDLAYVFDLNHRFTYANDALLRVWGKTWDQAIGRTCLELGYEPWHAAMHDREIDKVIASRNPVRGEVPFNGALGRRIYDYIFVPVLNAAGEVEAVAGTNRDVTERKEAEEALRASELRLNLALDGGQMGLWEWHIENNRSVWNAKEYELLGLSPGAAKESAETFMKLVHPEDLPRLQQSIGAVMERGNDWRDEFRIIRPDGHVRWVAAVARIHRDPEGRAVTMIGLNYDITDRKQEEVTAQQNRERLQFLTNASEVGIWFCDLPFDELVWDDRVKEHFWLPPGARVTIDTFYERLHPEDRERTRETIAHSIATGGPYNIDYRTVSDDGREKWIRAIGHAHYNGHGKPIRFDGLTIDITESKRAESWNRFLLRLDDALRPLADPEEITLTAARVLGQHLRADRCAYADVEADEDSMNLTGNYIRGPEIKSIVGRLKFSDFGPEAQRLMRENKPHVIHDIEAHQPPVPDGAAYRATQIRAVICVPLHKSGKLIAAMAVHMATPRRWTDDEVALVGAVAARSWESIERARLARGLHETEQRIRQMADSAPVLIWQTDDAGVVFVNQQYLNFFGATFEEVQGMGWAGFMHPADRDEYLGLYAAAFKEQRPYDMECRFRRRDGEYRWLNNRGVPRHSHEGVFLGFFGSSADVTEIKESEAALRASEERYRSLFESIDEGFCVIEMLYDQNQAPVDYRFIEVNPAFERQAGMKGATGKRMLEFVSDIEPHWLQNYSRVALTGEPIRFADEYKSLQSWFDVYAFRVGDPQGRRVAVIFNNITNRKEAEAALLRSRAELAAANEQLASRAKLLNKLVDQRTSELQETVHQLETFSYSIVHDLRAPLRSMRSFAGFLNEGHSERLDDQARNYLRRIMDSAARMDALITDVLSYSRVTRGPADLVLVDLDRLVPEIIEQYPNLQENAKAIRVERPLPKVLGNTALLTQVFSNLLANALKFVPAERAPQVLVRADIDGDSVRVWVEDNGIGVPPEHHERIFGLFQRLHNAKQYSGTGVGLAIVRRAAEKMGGKAGISSIPDKGSRFWIDLRLAR